MNIEKEKFEAANASFILGAQARSRSLVSSGVIDLNSSPSKSLPRSQNLREASPSKSPLGSQDRPDKFYNEHAPLSPLDPQPDPCLSLPIDFPSPPETMAPSTDLVDELAPSATWPVYPGDVLEHGGGDAEDEMDVDSAAGESAHKS